MSERTGAPMSEQTRTPAQKWIQVLDDGAPIGLENRAILARAEEVAASVAALAERFDELKAKLDKWVPASVTITEDHEQRLAALESPAAAPEPVCAVCGHEQIHHIGFGAFCAANHCACRGYYSVPAEPEPVCQCGHAKSYHRPSCHGNHHSFPIGCSCREYVPAEPPAAVPETAKEILDDRLEDGDGYLRTEIAGVLRDALNTDDEILTLDAAWRLATKVLAETRSLAFSKAAPFPVCQCGCPKHHHWNYNDGCFGPNCKYTEQCERFVAAAVPDAAPTDDADDVVSQIKRASQAEEWSSGGWEKNQFIGKRLVVKSGFGMFEPVDIDDLEDTIADAIVETLKRLKVRDCGSLGAMSATNVMKAIRAYGRDGAR